MRADHLLILLVILAAGIALATVYLNHRGRLSSGASKSLIAIALLLAVVALLLPILGLYE